MTLCRPCYSGKHPHDRYTNTGADAGCPNLTIRLANGLSDLNSECTCAVVLPPVASVRCKACGCPGGHR
jgi:hypothetical protein